MSFNFNNNIPIYIQLVSQIKIGIISGKFTSGERLPSVRDLALQMKVNPNTMQKALAELEEMGLIFTERTNGKFVTDNQTLIDKYKKEYADELCETYFSAISELGFERSDAINYLENYKGEKV